VYGGLYQSIAHTGRDAIHNKAALAAEGLAGDKRQNALTILGDFACSTNSGEPARSPDIEWGSAADTAQLRRLRRIQPAIAPPRRGAIVRRASLSEKQVVL
jgi:hypothetical protein